MFLSALGVLKDHKPYKLLQWAVLGSILMCALRFFNTAETDLIGDDSNYPLRQWNSALSSVLRDCLSY